MGKILYYYKQKLTPPYNKKDIPLLAVVLLSILLTVTLFSISSVKTSDTNLKSHAQAMNNAVEPEDGSLNGNTTVINDQSASGGRYVRLGSLAASTTPTPTAGPANLTINYSSTQSQEPLNHVALGYLHGLQSAGTSNKISPASFWAEIAPNIIRTYPSGIAPMWNENLRLGGSAGMDMAIVMSDGWGKPGKGDPAPWGSDYNNPDYSAYLNYAVKAAGQFKNSGVPVQHRIYDFWNEPNNEAFYLDWNSAEATNGWPRFKELWGLFYKLMKVGLPGYNGGVAVDPGARLTAPGGSLGLRHLGDKDTFTTSFMQYAKDNNVVPDIWNWHFGDPYTIREFNRVMDYAQSIGASRDAMILEYMRESDGKRPGRLIYEIALLESATHAGDGKKVIGAAHARWPTTTEGGNSLFYSNGAWRKHGDWYVYANYKKMTGKEAQFTYGTGVTKFGAAASIDSGSKKAWALIGNDAYDQNYKPAGDTADLGTVSVRLDGISSADASDKVNVTVSRIPYANFGEVNDVDIVKVINNASYTISGNSITITIPWSLAIDGYFVEVNNIIQK